MISLSSNILGLFSSFELGIEIAEPQTAGPTGLCQKVGGQEEDVGFLDSNIEATLQLKQGRNLGMGTNGILG